MSLLAEIPLRLWFSTIVVIALVVILLRFRAGQVEARDSLDHLYKRMKNGEITKEEYEAAKKEQGK